MDLTRRRILTGMAALAAVLAAGPARAQTLDQAKAAGLVGEMPNGYVGAVQGGAEVQALVDSVNAQRRAAYQDVARRTGAPLAAVEQEAGAKLIARAPAGQFVLNASGQWVRK